MSRRSLAFGICFLLMCSMIIPISIGYDIKNIHMKPSISNINGKTLYVGGSGPDNYTKIQDAIDNARDGDTVYVFNDSSPYYERLVINKSIDLIGEDRDTTVIDGNYSGNVVEIHADSVKVCGFTIINCSTWDKRGYCVYIINCEDVIIKDNKISVGKDANKWSNGIFLENTINNLIQDNIIFKGNSYCSAIDFGIFTNSLFNNISGNEIYGYGLAIDVNENSDYNTIYGNYIHDNGGGVYAGYVKGLDIINNKIINSSNTAIFLFYTNEISISNNIIVNNGGGEGGGICLLYGENNRIIDNYISEDRKFGFYTWSEENDVISGNIIENNGEGGIYLDGIFCHVTKNQISNNNGIGIKISGLNIYFTDNHISDNIGYGIYLSGGNSVIARNNFINNPINAYFKSWLLNILLNNRWNANYYSDYNGGRFYKIHGILHFFIWHSWPWLNIDWNPAKESYDIGIRN